MRPRLHSFAWIAALGILLQAGSAMAAVWCPEQGLLPSCCCPVETEEDAAWTAPSACCRPALAAPEFSQATQSAPAAPTQAILSWEEPLPAPPSRLFVGVEAPEIPASQLGALSTIVLIQ